MISGKFDPQPFFRQTEHVALHVAADEIFGLLARTMPLPGVWAALVKYATGDHAVVAAGGRVDGSDAADVLFVRTTPVEVKIAMEGLVSRDKFQCRADVAAAAHVIPERSELISFHRMVLGSHRVARAEMVARAFEPAVRTALARFAAEHDAAELMSASAAEKASALVGDVMQRLCFESGLALSGKPFAHFSSAALKQVRQAEEESARRMAEHEARRKLDESVRVSQAQHFDHLSGLLARLAELSSSAPGVEVPELIRTFTEQQRGQLYEALFARETPAVRTQWIIAACADELLFFEAGQPAAPLRRLTIKGPAGALRSVQPATGHDGRPVLLLGASRGVYSLPLDRAEPDVAYVVPDAREVRGGFNAAAISDGSLVATHSELGIWAWPMARGSAPELSVGRPLFPSLTAGARAIRDVELFRDECWCAVDDKVICWPSAVAGDSPARIYTGSASTITAISPSAEALFAGNSEGEILHWPRDRADAPERLHRGSNRAAESLWLTTTQGVRRLTFTDTTLHVHTRVLGDNFVCRYEAGGQTLRRVEVAPDLLVAVNDLRDRLFCWQPGRPGTPIASISVAAMCGHTVQDLCLVLSA